MSIGDEFEGLDLGDVRREARLVRVAERLASDPKKSIAAAMVTIAEREGAYRLLSNEAVVLERVLAPHVAKTADRSVRAKRIVVAHDTTEVGFSTPRAGLGRVNDGDLGHCFFLHTALAVSRDGRREPLGVLGARPHMRMKLARGRQRHTERIDEAKKESARWWQLVENVASVLADGTDAIHVMDREADNFTLFARLLEGGHRFVIRGNHDRRIKLDGKKDPTLKQELARLTGRVTRQITIGPREPKPLAQPLLPPSRARAAILEFRATEVTLCRPTPAPITEFELPPTLPVRVVHVVEPEPPDGYAPIEWKLYTSEPVDTVAQIEAIVDAYDTRWVIEEYFKALKTGCALEQRELESAQTILGCLGILMPIAWSLLRIRTLARDAGDAPATTVLPALQIKVLQRIEHVRMRAIDPTVADVYAAIAVLGCHIKQNGPPGWQVLMRGYQELLALARGAALIAASSSTTTCDQPSGFPGSERPEITRVLDRDGFAISRSPFFGPTAGAIHGRREIANPTASRTVVMTST